MNVVLVNLLGLALIALVVWWFWLSESAGAQATVTATGVQETRVRVAGGYDPDVVRVEAGRPVRLVFHREEASPCSERVVFDAFGVSADLPTGVDVPVQFIPPEPGEYEFTCQMGMLRGKVVAT